jgi:hypothetical protein
MQAVYMAFHVKLACLWISSVDNLRRGADGTHGDRLRLPRPLPDRLGVLAVTQGN